MCVTLPILVLNSIERKNGPCKSDSLNFTLLEKMRDTLPFVVFNSLEGKNSPRKSDSRTFYRF